MARKVIPAFIPLPEHIWRQVATRFLQSITCTGCDSGGSEIVVYPNSNAVARSSGGDHGVGDDILQGLNSSRVVQRSNNCR